MKKFTAFIAVIVTALSVSAMPALSSGEEAYVLGEILFGQGKT